MGDERDYKVINEKILPKKGRLIKKIFGIIALIVLGAIGFGAIERTVFEFTGKLFPPLFIEKEKKERVELVNHKEKPESEQKQVVSDKVIKKEALPEKTIIQKDIKVVEKKLNLSDYSELMREFGKVAEVKNKSVVEVQSVVMGKDWFENPYENITSIAGFIMAKQGNTAYILTKYSRIKKAGEIKLVFASGLITDAKLKNYNSFLDFAILTADLSEMKEEEAEEILPVDIPSDEFVNLGRPIMALGNPDGMLYSVLFGQVTNTRGLYYLPDYVFDAFYIDIKLAKDSFVMLLDTEGKVLGISLPDKSSTSSKVLATGRVVRLIENMINDKPSPYLGIITKEFAGFEGKVGRDGGILVGSVVEDSPADKAGFKEGDIILSFGNTEIQSIEDYLEVLEGKKVGEMVKLKVYRVSRNIGSEIEVEAIIGDSRGLK